MQHMGSGIFFKVHWDTSLTSKGSKPRKIEASSTHEQKMVRTSNDKDNLFYKLDTSERGIFSHFEGDKTKY